MIAHILLLPHESTRAALLAPGAPVWIDADSGEPAEFGWVVDPTTPAFDDDVPDVVDGYGQRIKASWPSLGVGSSAVSMLHLVLARDGDVVPEGVDRLVRAERAACPESGWWFGPDLEDALRQIMAGTAPVPVPAAAFPLGTIVLLDGSGKEVSP